MFLVQLDNNNYRYTNTDDLFKYRKITRFQKNLQKKGKIGIYPGTTQSNINTILNQIKLSIPNINNYSNIKNIYNGITICYSNNNFILNGSIKKMEKINETIETFPELSKPVSITNLVKYSKQAYYKGIPKYYQLPTSQEQSYIFAYTKNSNSETGMLKNFVDSTGRYARITTFMKDIGTEKMNIIQERLKAVIVKEFPSEKYDVSLTGKALVFIKGTNYLIKNLVISLSLAIFLIAIFMAWMFRSPQMIFISLIPNILPLLITAGLMGFLGVPIKPSTILVFSIAFGISVDDTIHFLAKYRQELIANKWSIVPSVYAALRETGVSMFYTSIVLFFGFLVFTLSSFGGTIALGGLVSITLLLAMVSNLLLLPSLLLTFEKKIANKKVFKEPAMKIFPPKEENTKV